MDVEAIVKTVCLPRNQGITHYNSQGGSIPDPDCYPSVLDNININFQNQLQDCLYDKKKNGALSAKKLATPNDIALTMIALLNEFQEAQKQTLFKMSPEEKEFFISSFIDTYKKTNRLPKAQQLLKAAAEEILKDIDRYSLSICHNKNFIYYTDQEKAIFHERLSTTTEAITESLIFSIEKDTKNFIIEEKPKQLLQAIATAANALNLKKIKFLSHFFKDDTKTSDQLCVFLGKPNKDTSNEAFEKWLAVYTLLLCAPKNDKVREAIIATKTTMEQAKEIFMHYLNEQYTLYYINDQHKALIDTEIKDFYDEPKPLPLETRINQMLKIIDHVIRSNQDLKFFSLQ